MNDWAKHLQEIFDDVSSLVENRYVFNRFREILKPNMSITNNIFFDHYVVNYANAATASVRRQVDQKATRGGLRMLLESILKNPELITKEDYMRPFGGALKFTGERIWAERYGGKDFLDPAVVQADILLLENTTKKLKDMADKNVAHKDKDAHLYTIQYKDLDDAVDLLERLTIKYYSLITSPGAGINSLLATNLSGWENVFSEPWVK
jgi:hypothetical protein